MMKVVLDAFGGDNAPREIIKGAILAINQFDNLTVVLSGDEQIINQQLEQLKQEYGSFDNSRLEILHAPEIITNDDKPTEAIRTKKESSLVKALDLLKKDDDVIATISAGSTGAILTGGFMKIGRLKGVSRPALAGTLPSLNGNPIILMDCGANMDCKPINLVHFGIMGNEYYKSMFEVQNPTVALLSVGTEDEKGNELVKSTLPVMKTLPINFVGNMEARDFLSGNYQIVVADGFAGNTLLKSSEGAILSLVSLLKTTIKQGSLSTKIGGALIKKPLKNMLKKFDYSNYGGSPLLGLKKTVIKAHGSSKAKSIVECIKQAIMLAETNCNAQIEEKISTINMEE